MNKKLFRYEIIGFVFVSIVGTLAHFVYEWTGESVAAGLFCPINESSWEHLKLIFFPYLIWSLVEICTIKESWKIIFAKFIGVFTAMAVTLSFFYTYSGITGRNISFLNILSFFVGVAAGFLVDYVIIKSGKLQGKFLQFVGVIFWLLLASMFFLFTFAPPLIPLFKDPITASYGI